MSNHRYTLPRNGTNVPYLGKLVNSLWEVKLWPESVKCESRRARRRNKRTISMASRKRLGEGEAGEYLALNDNKG